MKASGGVPELTVQSAEAAMRKIYEDVKRVAESSLDGPPADAEHWREVPIPPAGESDSAMAPSMKRSASDTALASPKREAKKLTSAHNAGSQQGTAGTSGGNPGPQ